MKWLIPFLLVISVGVVTAQQIDVQHLIPVLQKQRNDAEDRAAVAEALAAQYKEELDKLKAEQEKTKEQK